MRPVKTLLALVLTALMATACYYPTPPPDDGWTVGDGSLDTTAFVRHHHYGPNFNFKVTADTLSLAPCRPGTSRLDSWADTAVVRRGDKIVVADIALVPSDTTDSVWLKLARDQTTMGWTSERRLAEAAVPDDPISQFIHTFSGSRTRLALCIVGLMAAFFLVQAARRRHLHVVHFNDIDSFYPTLLCLTVSGAATLYGSLQHFVPETWVEFYYHPTLNPFGLPLVMSVFVASVWLMGVTALAVLDDVRRRLDWADIPAYVAGLAGVCMVLYLFFSLSAPYYVGYPCLVAYWAFAIRSYARHRTPRYVCGRCGAALPRLGRCPHCGAMNE